MTAGGMWMYGSIQHSRLENCHRTYAAQRAIIDAAYGPDPTDPSVAAAKARVMAQATGTQCNIIHEPFWYR